MTVKPLFSDKVHSEETEHVVKNGKTIADSCETIAKTFNSYNCTTAKKLFLWKDFPTIYNEKSNIVTVKLVINKYENDASIKAI